MPKKLNDVQLYKICKKYGHNSLKWRWKFMGLLPEVSERKLWAKKGYSSIYEFAAKLAGVSKEQVNRALNLGQKLASLPSLHTLFTKGEVSFNKLRRASTIATPQNEAQLAQKVKLLSKNAIDIMVRDFKSENGLHRPNKNTKSGPGPTIELSKELQERLLNLKAKGHDINQLLLKLLDQRDAEISSKKQEIAAEQESKRRVQVSLGLKPSRYTPVKVKKILKEEYGSKCAIPSCTKHAQETHYTARFALSGIHDPRYMAPLCKGHHELALNCDAKTIQHKLE